MMNKFIYFTFIFCAVVTASCTTSAPFKDDGVANRDISQAGFIPAYFNLLSYAKHELQVDLSEKNCTDCSVRVIEARDVVKYVDINRVGYSGEKIRAVQRAIIANKGRAVVLTDVPIPKTGKIQNLVFLPMDKAQFSSCPDSTNAAILVNTPQTALACGLRTFGLKGSGPHCGVCAIGLCCGACKCKSCNVFAVERVDLDLPDRFDKLLDRSVALIDIPLNIDLL
jgi:hypothetical protein